MQMLWQTINPNQENEFNACAEAAITLFGAVGAFLAGYMNTVNIELWDMWTLTICSVVEGLLLILASMTNCIWVSYVAYVLFGMIYYFMLTIAR